MTNLPDEYFLYQRPEIAALIEPAFGMHVLDIGCATGGLGVLLREKGVASLSGVELHEGAAAKAKTIYDQVCVGDIERIDLPWKQESFDFIVCADVLEHLVDPWNCLLKLKPLLKPHGSMIASIPNIRYRAVLGEILQGDFTYQPQGILDRTHLRFFTFKTIAQLFDSAGFTISSIGPVYPTNAPHLVECWKQAGIARKLEEIIHLFSGVKTTVTNDDLEDLVAVQYVLKAGKKSNNLL